MSSEYHALVRDAFDWKTIDQYGHVTSTLDPFEVLRASDAPEAVINTFRQAQASGCLVRFEGHSCHLGGSESVSVLGPVPDDVRKLFDAVDRSNVRDASWRRERWTDGRSYTDQRERWEWVTDMS